MFKKIDFTDKAVINIIAINLLPIIGVLFLNWYVFETIILYVAETFIIGVFNIFLVIKERNNKVKNSIFGLLVYYIFILVQFIFVVILWTIVENGLDKFGQGGLAMVNELFTSKDFIIAIIIIIFSYLVSFYKKYFKKDNYLKIDIEKIIGSSFKRIFVQQFMVLFGGFIIAFTEAPIGILIILIILKTVLDLREYQKKQISKK